MNTVSILWNRHSDLFCPDLRLASSSFYQWYKRACQDSASRPGFRLIGPRDGRKHVIKEPSLGPSADIVSCTAVLAHLKSNKHGIASNLRLRHFGCLGHRIDSAVLEMGEACQTYRELIRLPELSLHRDPVHNLRTAGIIA